MIMKPWHLKAGSLGLLAVLALVVMAGTGCVTKSEVSTAVDPSVETEPDPFKEDAEILYAMSRLFISQEKEARAEATLRRLIDEYPDFTASYSDLSELLLGQERHEEALAVLEKGLEVTPDSPVLLNNAGVCYLLEGDLVRALDHFNRASEIRPISHRFQANRALALGLMGEYEQAEELYAGILTDVEVKHNMNIIRSMRGDTSPPEPKTRKKRKAEKEAQKAAEQADESAKQELVQPAEDELEAEGAWTPDAASVPMSTMSGGQPTRK